MDKELLKLEDICEKYFGVSPRIARHKAALGTLPIPAFRLTNSGRGPLFVDKEALDTWVEDRIAKASKLHKQMAAVAA